MKAAGKAVGAARFAVELATGMQAGEHDLDHGHLFLGMQPNRDAATVVVDRETSVLEQRQVDGAGVAAERFVRRVVDDLLDDVKRGLGAGVHAGPLADRLEPLEDLDRSFGVPALLADSCRHREIIADRADMLSSAAATGRTSTTCAVCSTTTRRLRNAYLMPRI
jgi:hypothetical protein